MILAAPVLGQACGATLCNEDGGNGAFWQAWAAAQRCLLLLTAYFRIQLQRKPSICWDVNKSTTEGTFTRPMMHPPLDPFRAGRGRETPSGSVIGPARRLHRSALIDEESRDATLIIIILFMVQVIDREHSTCHRFGHLFRITATQRHQA